MLAAHIITTLKLVTDRKGFLFSFPRREETLATDQWNDRRHRLGPAPFFLECCLVGFSEDEQRANLMVCSTLHLL